MFLCKQFKLDIHRHYDWRREWFLHYIIYRPFNLRRHGYIKPFLISSVWVISCSLVPLIENKLLTEHSIWFVVSQIFVLYSVLCLLFDIKDSVNDFFIRR
jgi:hypothetical protein